MTAETTLTVSGLTKTFRRRPEEVQVLKGADLTVARAESLAIIGASGSGKSTLLHLLGGLDKPDSGSIHYGEQELGRLNEREMARFRNRMVGFVFQFHYLLPEFSALENVMMPALVTGQASKAVKRQALDLLETVGLTHRLHHKPGEMSGGEQQRVAIARALVMQPRVLLADEPTGDLDPTTGQRVTELFGEIRSRTGISLIVVTHNLELARTMDRTLILRGGQLEPQP